MYLSRSTRVVSMRDALSARRARRRALRRMAHAPAWRAVALRGIATLLLGGSVLVVPDLSVVLLLALLAGYAIVSAATTLAVARHVLRARERVWPLALYAAAAAGFASAVLWWPLMTPLAVTGLFVLWVVAAGAVEVALGVWLRGLVPHAWLLGAAGVGSVGVVIAALTQPARAVELAMRLAGGYAVLCGVFLCELALTLRKEAREARSESSGTGAPDPGDVRRPDEPRAVDDGEALSDAAASGTR
jgi:uncharacterized membrane protein HdeD (DUF308 family)